MNELTMPKKASSIITVIGVGGAGGNAVNHMWNTGIKGVNFLICNTDQRAMDNSPVEDKIRLGHDGLGAGNDPERGREAAVESLDQIKQYIEGSGTRMVFITAGMGGGTGTGASPVIAKLAHEMGLLTVANVTSPLTVEGPTRCEQAVKGIEELRKYADSLLVINNESIREMYGKLPIRQAFGKADDILAAATKGIAEIITVESALIRVDFADLERVMRGSGRAHMGVASAEGEGRALEAARRSLCSPLLDNNLISGAKNILISISAANIDDVAYDEAMEVLNYIQSYASYKDEDGVKLTLEPIGHRPGGGQKDEVSVLQAARGAMAALGIPLYSYAFASTDHNVAVNKGIPATTLGGGGKEGFNHNVKEWYEPVDAYQGPQLAMLTSLVLVGVEGVSEPVLEKRA